MVDIQEVLSEFQNIFGSTDGVRLFRAPGRVNIIGEHTDYNDGFVLPIAIDLDTVVAARPREDFSIVTHSINKNEKGSFDLTEPKPIQKGYWLNYVEGTARTLQKKGFRIGGADIVLKSDVPTGAGLSSSASLEMAVATALVLLEHQPLDRKEMALACQQGEQEYTGAMIGIMDQFISAMGEEDAALLIDCRSLHTRSIPIDPWSHSIIVCDSGVKHDLATSEYNKRREECKEAVRALKKSLPDIESLRDVSEEDFHRFENTLPDVLRKRTRHVVTENARTLDAAEALRNGNYRILSDLLYASHTSLRDDYEVSAPELDFLVETACEIPGVDGSRMTGGGFGGCTISFVEQARTEEFSEHMKRKYRDGMGKKLTVYHVRISQGAEEITDEAPAIVK